MPIYQYKVKPITFYLSKEAHKFISRTDQKTRKKVLSFLEKCLKKEKSLSKKLSYFRLKGKDKDKVVYKTTTPSGEVRVFRYVENLKLGKDPIFFAITSRENSYKK